MTPRLAIHHRPRSFSDRWIAYCDEHRIPYQPVNCLATDISRQLQGVEGLLWHWHHQNPGDQLIARQIIMAAEMKGLAVFPSSATCWHFDDKLAQKYFLEALGAPLVPSYVFYDANDAREWIRSTSFPKVFKLRTGGG